MKTGSPATIVLLAALSGLVTSVLPLGLVVAPGLFAYGMFRTRPWLLALFTMSFLIPALLLYTPLTAICIALLLCGMAGALYVLSRQKLGNVYTVMVMGCICAACLYCALCLPGILSGEGAFSAVQAVVDQALALSREALDAMVTAGANPDAAKALDSYYSAVSAAVPVYVVPVICSAACLLGLSNLLFFRLFARKRTAEFGLVPLRPFRLWQIPRNLVYGLFALLIGSLIMEWTGWGYAEGLSATVSAVGTLPLILQGLCVVDFLLYRTGKNVTRRRTLVYIATSLLFNMLQAPLLMLGGFEQLFHFRARLASAPPSGPLNRL